MSALVPATDPDRLAVAYAYCERIAREHYENFPVASRLLSAAARPHIAAIYAFARRADDFADEPGLAAGERLRLLDAWGRRLNEQSTDRGLTPSEHAAERGLTPGVRSADGGLTPAVRSADRGLTPSVRSADRGLTPGVRSADGGLTPRGGGSGDDLIFCALEHTIRAHRLPRTLFHDLLSAFRQDVMTTRYPSWADLLDYCRRSANPIGRLVLRVAGYHDPGLDAHSDAVCTALQLTNFWQDLARDWTDGRLYVPIEDRDRAGARDADLDAGRITPEWQAVLRSVAARTRGLFDAGRPVCDGVRGRLRWELRLTWLGGTRILEKLEAIDFDVFQYRPTLTPRDVPGLAWRAVRWPVGSG